MAFPKLAVRSRYGEHRSPASASLPLPHVGRSAKERLEALGYVLSFYYLQVVALFIYRPFSHLWAWHPRVDVGKPGRTG